MKIQAVCEYNCDGYLFYATDYPGAYVRGAQKEEALAKFGGELRSYQRWCDVPDPDPEAPEIEIVQTKLSALQICDVDSDVLFDAERQALSQQEYERLKFLVLKSARDFRKLFTSIPNPDISDRPSRQTFYGAVPRTPREMYEHTNRVTAYYLAPFGIEMENLPDIYSNRMQALSLLEELPTLLSGEVHMAEDGEEWTVRKAMRRFIWHDRIHAKAMWRTATALWGSEIQNPFFFTD